MEKSNEFLASLQRANRVDLGDAPEPEKKETDTPADPPADKKPDETEKAPADSDAGDKKPEGEAKGAEGDKKPEDKKPDAKEGDKSDKPDEKPLPFHKHPRWIATQDELKELREFKVRVVPLLEKLETSKPTEETAAIPEWFVELFGENKGAWEKYRAYDAGQRTQLRKEIAAEIQQTQQQYTKAEKDADQAVADALQALTDEGLEFNRNEVLKIAIDYQPTGEDGKISLRKAYDIWKGFQKPGPVATPPEKKVEAKKIIADQTMKGSKTEGGGAKDFMTQADLAGKSFRELAK